HHLQITDGVGRAGAAVRLDEGRDHIGAPRRAPTTLVEHGERLADARRGAEVDPELTARHTATLDHDAFFNARFSFKTFTPSSPRNPSDGPSVLSSMSCFSFDIEIPRASETRRAW